MRAWHALRGAAAVHLASALAIADPDLIIAVWDRRLHAGAAAAGLLVTPAQLPGFYLGRLVTKQVAVGVDNH